MAIIGIIQFGPASTLESVIETAAQAFKEGTNPPGNIVLGTQIQDKRAIQITSEWNGVQDPPNLETFHATPESQSYTKNLVSIFGEPSSVYHVALNRSGFGSDGPVAQNVVEYVKIYFQASRVTPAFQKQIEDDFAKFEATFSKGVEGFVGLATGWVVEEQEHENLGEEKAKCYLVVKGWESQGHFERSIRREAYKEAIPILLAWKAPVELWHVEQSLLHGGNVVA